MGHVTRANRSYHSKELAVCEDCLAFLCAAIAGIDGSVAVRLLGLKHSGGAFKPSGIPAYGRGRRPGGSEKAHFALAAYVNRQAADPGNGCLE